MSTNKDHEKIEPSHNQLSPRDARPEDFVVNGCDDDLPATPGHGQHGDSPAEYRKMLAHSEKAHGKSIPGRPHDAIHIATSTGKTYIEAVKD